MTNRVARAPASRPHSTPLLDAQIRFQVDDEGRLYAFVPTNSSRRLALWPIAFLAGAIGGAAAAFVVLATLP